MKGDLASGSLPPLRGFHHVFHLAGVTRALRPRDYFRVNAKGTEALLEALEAVEGRFLYLSSLAAQGPSVRGRPLREDDPPQPVSPYGQSKLEGERAVLRHKDRFSVAILRPAAVYGPRDDYMVEFFRLVAKGLLPLLRQQWLSLVYVADLVEALLLAAKGRYPSGEVFLISDGRSYPLQEIADVVASFLGKKYKVVKVPLPLAKAVALLGEGVGRLRGKAVAFGRSKLAEALQEAWICDISKAREVLRFEPRYSLAEGLRVTLRWYREAGWL